MAGAGLRVGMRMSMRTARRAAACCAGTAPTAVRAANVRRLREWVEVAMETDRRVIVLTTLPVKGGVHRKIRRDLDGLDYTLNEQGIMEHPMFGDWVDSVIASAAP